MEKFHVRIVSKKKWRIKFVFQLSLMTHCLAWTMQDTHTHALKRTLIKRKKPTKLYAWQPTCTHVSRLARLYSYVLRSLLIRSRRKRKRERERGKSNQTLMCGFAAWDLINVFIVVKRHTKTIEAKERRKIFDDDRMFKLSIAKEKFFDRAFWQGHLQKRFLRDIFD